MRDPSFADTKDSDIVNFTIASSRKYKDKEDVTFLDATAYGQTAVNIAKFFKKGNPIGVEGRLSQNNWVDRDDNKRSKIYITVNSFHFTGNTDDAGGGRGRSGDSRRGGSERGDSRSGGNRGRNDERGGRGGRRDEPAPRDNRERGQRDGSQGGGRDDDGMDDVPF